MDCLQVLDVHDLSAPKNGTLDLDTTSNDNADPPIRAVFSNQNRMNDAEHMAWTISCNYQRTLHPLYRKYINRIDEMRRKQRQYIYNTLNNARTGTEDATKTSAVGDDVDNSVESFQSITTGLKVTIAKPTAVHISILKIQS